MAASVQYKISICVLMVVTGSLNTLLSKSSLHVVFRSSQLICAGRLFWLSQKILLES